MTQASMEKTGPTGQAFSTQGHARGILDLSSMELVEPPSLVEEELLKTKGIISAEVNVFSKRITVEFDPSSISLEAIRKIIRRHRTV